MIQKLTGAGSDLKGSVYGEEIQGPGLETAGEPIDLILPTLGDLERLIPLAPAEADEG